ncbi:hypothetical protein CXT99_06040 [Akkermansia muciniphila]|nr:hypothetical protein [Akkermansia sp.]PNC66117.1 hypothetical protein CXU00_05055 [Akkermansia muciniphila]PNC66992.1 hypothetical protein CXT99_06040 [Akkermansia muciniphila]PNC89580.1 hypothetical protein CXU03_05270 [Akkermansia muciniphila]QAT92063.1 hypothetical protein AKKM5201_09040 [Akkermansia muciniphila]
MFINMFPPLLLSQVFRQHILQGLMQKPLIGFPCLFIGIKEPMNMRTYRHIAHQPFFLSPVHSTGKRDM